MCTGAETQCRSERTEKVTVFVCPCPAAFCPGAGAQRLNHPQSQTENRSVTSARRGEDGEGDEGENDLNKIFLRGFCQPWVVRVIGGRGKEVSVGIFWRANSPGAAVTSVAAAEVH